MARDPRARIAVESKDFYLFELNRRKTSKPSPITFRFQLSETTPFDPKGDRRSQLLSRQTSVQWIDEYVEIRGASFVDLATETGVKEDSCVFLRTTVESPERPMQLLIGTDDDAAVWVNDHLAYVHVGPRAARPREDAFWLSRTTDNKGEPRATLVLRVCQGDRAWGLFLEKEASWLEGGTESDNTLEE